MADDKFTIVIKRSPDYKIYPCNVIYGAPTPDGQGILMNVCIDHAPFPNYIQHSIVEGNIDMSNIADQAIMGNLEREVLCGLSMSVTQAKTMLGWLKQTLDKIERHGHG